MLDDFFLRAVVAAIGAALVAGPLGSFVVWRRMAYFGDAMAHAALLGVAVGFLLETGVVAGVFAVSAALALCLLGLSRLRTLPNDAILGILSHTTLAAGLVVLSLMASVRTDLMGYLFGDILAVSRADLVLIYAGAVVVLAALAAVWRPLLAATVSGDIARAEVMSPARAELVFLLLIAAVIAIAMQIVGVLLITALLIIPAATARGFTASPEAMAAGAAAVGACAAIGGLFLALMADTPAGPSIVVAAGTLFAVQLVARALIAAFG